MNSILDIKEFEQHALKALPENITAFFSSRAGDEVTLGENASAFDRIKLLPRVLKNVEKRSLSTTILDQVIDFPRLIAPMAFQRLAHPDREIATAKAAQDHNVLMVLSTYSTCSFEEIQENTNISPWFQLYIYKDRTITQNLVQLAESFGYKGIVLTVDAPLYGKRIKELHHPIVLSPDFEIKNLQSAGLNINLRRAKNSYSAASYGVLRNFLTLCANTFMGLRPLALHHGGKPPRFPLCGLKDIPSIQLTGHLASLLDPRITWGE